VTWFPDSVARNRQRELTHEQKFFREDKHECVDILTDAVHGQDHSISDEGTPMKTRSFPNRVPISCAVRRDASGAPMDPNVEDTHSLRVGASQRGRQDHRRNDSVVAFTASQARATP
jgi:hypothetical protein